jgi:hypothetical protein
MYCGGGQLGFPIDIKNRDFVEDLPMTATAGLSLTLDPMGKMFQNAFSLKPPGQLKPNGPGMIIGRSSTKSLFFMSIGNPSWIGIKNTHFVEDLPMIIPGPFGFNCPGGFREEAF